MGKDRTYAALSNKELKKHAQSFGVAMQRAAAANNAGEYVQLAEQQSMMNDLLKYREQTHQDIEKNVQAIQAAMPNYIDECGPVAQFNACADALKHQIVQANDAIEAGQHGSYFCSQLDEKKAELQQQLDDIDAQKSAVVDIVQRMDRAQDAILSCVNRNEYKPLLDHQFELEQAKKALQDAFQALSKMDAAHSDAKTQYRYYDSYAETLIRRIDDRIVDVMQDYSSEQIRRLIHSVVSMLEQNKVVYAAVGSEKALLSQAVGVLQNVAGGLMASTSGNLDLSNLLDVIDTEITKIASAKDYFNDDEKKQACDQIMEQLREYRRQAEQMLQVGLSDVTLETYEAQLTDLKTLRASACKSRDVLQARGEQIMSLLSLQPFSTWQFDQHLQQLEQKVDAKLAARFAKFSMDSELDKVEPEPTTQTRDQVAFDRAFLKHRFGLALQRLDELETQTFAYSQEEEERLARRIERQQRFVERLAKALKIDHYQDVPVPTSEALRKQRATLINLYRRQNVGRVADKNRDKILMKCWDVIDDDQVLQKQFKTIAILQTAQFSRQVGKLGRDLSAVVKSAVAIDLPQSQDPVIDEAIVQTLEASHTLERQLGQVKRRIEVLPSQVRDAMVIQMNRYARTAIEDVASVKQALLNTVPKQTRSLSSSMTALDTANDQTSASSSDQPMRSDTRKAWVRASVRHPSSTGIENTRPQFAQNKKNQENKKQAPLAVKAKLRGFMRRRMEGASEKERDTPQRPAGQAKSGRRHN